MREISKKNLSFEKMTTPDTPGIDRQKRRLDRAAIELTHARSSDVRVGGPGRVGILASIRTRVKIARLGGCEGRAKAHTGACTIVYPGNTDVTRDGEGSADA